MLETPARSEEVRAILEDVDNEIIERVIETGASIDEIAEAMHLVANGVGSEELPSTARAEEVRELLLEARGRGHARVVSVR